MDNNGLGKSQLIDALQQARTKIQKQAPEQRQIVAHIDELISQGLNRDRGAAEQVDQMLGALNTMYTYLEIIDEPERVRDVAQMLRDTEREVMEMNL